MEPTEEEVILILNSLSKNSPSDLARIFYGLNKYPMVGSEGDQKIKFLEEWLINEGLVEVIESGGTNNTINGYAYFVLSPLGYSRLNKQQIASRPFCGLSTQENDSALLQLGFSNRGIIGYIDLNRESELFALEQLKINFPEGSGFLYTTDRSKERLDSIQFTSVGSIGYVRKTPHKGYSQLHRFFNLNEQFHVFVTNPMTTNFPDSVYRDESAENPIYIKNNFDNNTAALLFYTNRKDLPIVTQSSVVNERSNQNGELISDLQLDLQELLDKSNLDPSHFTFEYLTDRYVLVKTKELNYSFSSTLVIADQYYNVECLPSISSNDNPKLKQEVIEEFYKWIGILEKEKLIPLKASLNFADAVEMKENIAINVTRRLHSSAQISIGDSQTLDAALGIGNLADEIVKIIKNLQPEPGNMVGIFGQWGRGKTRLMNEIWNRLKADKADREFVRIDFQAWRYQSTPSSWAYLYEQFSEAFLGNKKSVPAFFNYHRQLLKLNFEREGWRRSILLLLVLTITSLLLWFSQALKDTFLNWTSIFYIPLLGVGLDIIVRNFKLDHFSNAINLIKKYGVKTDFSGTLGVQAEIQKELIHLVNAWTKGKKNKKKLILFVDDLDRCTEEKTIEIIDALRIILDSKELEKKLLIITAIDERILQMAVSNKYPETIKNWNRDELIREYIDKLFIFSIKLAPLTEDESKEIFDKISKDNIEINSLPVTGSSPSIATTSITTEQTTKPGTEEKDEPVTLTSNTRSHSEPKVIFETIEKLTEREALLLKNHLHLIINSTPRKIRIIYYRYLFAKNLLINSNVDKTKNSIWLIEPLDSFLIKKLIVNGQELTNVLPKSHFNSLGDVALKEAKEINVSEADYRQMLKILELTIAY